LRTTAISAVLSAKIQASRSRLTKYDLIADSPVPAALVLGSLSQFGHSQTPRKGCLRLKMRGPLTTEGLRALRFPGVIGVHQEKLGDARRLPSSKLSSVLRQHPIFRDLEPDAVEQLCRYAKQMSLKRGATIFSKGDPGNSLFAVISGTVKISISSPDGRNAILNLISVGDVFGEMSVLDGHPRSTDAIANTNCELFVIDRRDFLPFVRSQPELAMKFIELLCTRVRWTSDQVEQVILQDLPGRLASALLGLTDRRKLEPESRTIAITQQEISEMVGMTRESINKQLRVWAMRSWVRLEHGAIVVLDAGSLRELVEAGSGADA
jgi:CRP/FNR family transcriptional regulator, cyclic AMP receptor protein